MSIAICVLLPINTPITPYLPLRAPSITPSVYPANHSHPSSQPISQPATQTQPHFHISLGHLYVCVYVFCVRMHACWGVCLCYMCVCVLTRMYSVLVFHSASHLLSHCVSVCVLSRALNFKCERLNRIPVSIPKGEVGSLRCVSEFCQQTAKPRY